MCATTQPAQAVPARDARPAAEAPGGRVDPVELAACRTALLEPCGREGAGASALVARLQGIGFPPLAPTWALLWSSADDTALSAALASAGVERLDLLGRLAQATPGPTLRRVLEARIVSEPSAGELTWMLDFLAEHGAWREVDLVLALSAVDVLWIGLDPADVDARAVDALRALLARDPKTYGALRSCVRVAPEDHAAVAIEALAGATGERALAALADLLDDRRIDACALLQAIEAVGRRSLPPFDDFLLRRLRELSREEDAALRAAALRASGALGDEDSLTLQIEGLADERGTVRSAAGAALTELTGLRLGPSPQRWTSWYAGESAWWDERAPRVLEQLEHDDPAVAIAALSELVPHRMCRGRLARAIAPRLDDDSPELRRLACLALEQLGSRAVAPQVLERLGDVDEGVRECAHHCLRSLFHVDLPPERDAWIDHLEQSDLALR